MTAARDVELSLTPEQAVTLYELVARSNGSNGLGVVYVQLGDLVRDENGIVPGYVGYKGPAWA